MPCRCAIRSASCARASGVSSLGGAFCHSRARLVASPFSCAATTSCSRPIPKPVSTSSSISRRSGCAPVCLDRRSNVPITQPSTTAFSVSMPSGGSARSRPMRLYPYVRDARMSSWWADRSRWPSRSWLAPTPYRITRRGPEPPRVGTGRTSWMRPRNSALAIISDSTPPSALSSSRAAPESRWPVATPTARASTGSSAGGVATRLIFTDD